MITNAKPTAFSYVKKSEFARKRREAGFQFQISRAAKYGYSNARVGAMKSLLLKKEFIQELARVRSVDGVIEQLERTYYKDNLVKLSMHYHGSELVQIATALHFAEVVNKLERITPDSDRKVFYAMLTKWDIVNAKSILNARRLGKRYEEVAPFLLPIGSFTESEAKSLLEESGENIFLKFAKTHLGKRLLASRIVSSVELEKLFINMGVAEISRLEAILDKFYYSLYITIESFSAKELIPIVRVFRREIDMKNISIIARLKHHGINEPHELEKYFIKGGFKSFKALSPIINAKSESEMLKAAAQLFGLKTLPTSLTEFEILLSNKLAESKLNAFYSSILSIGVILGFLFIKEEEINNIRKIVVGKEFGLSDEKIASMLILAG